MEEFQCNNKLSLLKFGIAEAQPILGEANFRTNEGRGQTCLDYAKCSRKWAKPKIVQGESNSKSMLA